MVSMPSGLALHHMMSNPAYFHSVLPYPVCQAYKQPFRNDYADSHLPRLGSVAHADVWPLEVGVEARPAGSRNRILVQLVRGKPCAGGEGGGKLVGQGTSQRAFRAIATAAK